MDGSGELIRLAALLRLGADTSREIAKLRPRDAASIEQLACQAEDIALQLEAMAAAREGALDN